MEIRRPIPNIYNYKKYTPEYFSEIESKFESALIDLNSFVDSNNEKIKLDLKPLLTFLSSETTRLRNQLEELS